MICPLASLPSILAIGRAHLTQGRGSNDQAAFLLTFDVAI
jgi:hypothetical protein